MGSLRADLAALQASIHTPSSRLALGDLLHERKEVRRYLAALERVAEIVGDTDPDHGIDDNVAIDRIRAVLAGLEKP